MVPYRKNFKNKLKLASTTPNAIMELNLLYNIRSIFDNQIQAKINNFIIQINDQGILGKITEIRLIDIQNKLLLPNTPLINFPFSNKDLIFMDKHLRNNFIINNIILMNNQNILLDFNKNNIGKNNTILGGGRHIMEIVGTENFLKNLKNLRINNLYFLDQFLTPDRRFLLTWWNIKNKKFASINSRNSNVVKTPNIYKLIKKIITLNNYSYKIKNEYIDNTIVSNLGGYDFLPIDIYTNNFITFFNFLEFENLYGKIIEEKQFTYYIQHFIRISETDDHNLLIKLCEGCEYNQFGNGNCIIEFMKNETYGIKFKRLIKMKGQKAYLLKEVQHTYIENLVRYDQFFKRNPMNFKSYDNFQLRFDENPLNIIEKYIDLSLDKQKLYNMKSILENLNQRIFTCYTDGSIKDINKEYVSATFGTTFYNSSSQRILELVSSYNNWISSTRAEIFALLITLIIAPLNSILTIYTDSANLISNFEKFKFFNFNLTTRQIFKISNNNILWKIIINIIKENNLSVILQKVQAHADNDLNNYVDNIVSLAHNDQNLNINLNYNNFEDLPWIPKWNGIVIEKSLRKMLTLTTNIKNLEKFINLNRNDKYRKIEIDWSIFFNNFKGEKQKLYTDFKESKIRRRKIQMMIEELPCIEQIKKTLYSLYKDRLCPMCEEEKESFNHIWICNKRRDDMQTLISGLQGWLLQEINKLLDPTYHIILEQIKDIDDIWNLDVSEDQFTFIDLIKGFFPYNLSNFFKHLLTTKSKIEQLSYNFRNEILDKSIIFWKERCNKLKEIDQNLGIDKNVKKQHFGKEQFIDEKRISKNKKYINLQSLQNHIYFGGNTIDYYNIVDHGSVS
jgi:ribonuclease HI